MLFNTLKVGYFTSQERKTIYAIVAKLGFVPHSAIVAVVENDETRAELEKCASLTATRNQRDIIALLKDAYLRRLVSKAINSTLESLPSILAPLPDVLGALDDKIKAIKLQHDGGTDGNARPASEIIGPMFTLMESLANPKGSTMIFTGLPFVDKRFGGTLPGELTVLGARPSVGKSAFALQVAVANSKMGKLVLFCSMEMSAESLMGRAVCAEAGISFGNFYSGLVTKDSLQKAATGASCFANNRSLYIRDVARDKPSAIRREIERVQNIESRKVDLVIIDHLHIGGADNQHKNRLEALTEISAGYKEIAMNYRCPVIALAQLTKSSSNENREPILSDLRECGAIEQDADRVIMLHRINNGATRQDYEPMSLMLLKARNSSVGVVRAVFHGKSTSFLECDDNFVPMGVSDYEETF